MEINFHYFAIKTLALRAGFNEEEAQTIATYSQMVDDFTDFYRFVAYKVPDYARHLAVPLVGDYYFFTPVTTGFPGYSDMYKISYEGGQKAINAPFHFIPYRKKLNENVTSRAEWRTMPARMDTNSLMQQLMNWFLHNDFGAEEPKLMYFGMLLHTFADTYAHQMFSGLNGWENECTFENVYNWDDYNSQNNHAKDQGFYQIFWPIGHARAGHIPDDTTVRFAIKMKDYRNEDIIYQRSNPFEYINASKEIYSIMRLYLGKDPLSDDFNLPFNEWDSFADPLCVALRDKNQASQEGTWTEVFQKAGYKYNYDANSVFNSNAVHNTPNEVLTIVEKAANVAPLTLPSLSYTMPDHYYRYNVFADKVRNFVNGQNLAEIQLRDIKETIEQIKKELNYEK